MYLFHVFCTNLLRPDADIFSLQKLIGHADIQALQRHLAHSTEDIAQAHGKGSRVDNNRLIAKPPILLHYVKATAMPSIFAELPEGRY